MIAAAKLAPSWLAPPTVAQRLGEILTVWGRAVAQARSEAEALRAHTAARDCLLDLWEAAGVGCASLPAADKEAAAVWRELRRVDREWWAAPGRPRG